MLNGGPATGNPIAWLTRSMNLSSSEKRTKDQIQVLTNDSDYATSIIYSSSNHIKQMAVIVDQIPKEIGNFQTLK